LTRAGPPSSKPNNPHHNFHFFCHLLQKGTQEACSLSTSAHHRANHSLLLLSPPQARPDRDPPRNPSHPFLHPCSLFLFADRSRDNVSVLCSPSASLRRWFPTASDLVQLPRPFPVSH
jgi:hypothetical protein